MISNQEGFEGFDRLIAAAPEASVSPVRSDVATMSSLQIAQITGKRHDHVLRDIESILEEAGIGAPKFGGTYLDVQNKERPCYNLPRRECDLVISGYSVKYRLAIIDRWQELEAKAAAPRDPMEILKDPAAMRGLLLTYSEKVLELETTVSTLTPKAEALDRLTLADGSVCITVAAKLIQVRPKELFTYLQKETWIYRRGAHWSAYQYRIQQGVLDEKVTTVTRSDGSEKVCEQVLVTAKGLARLAELMGTKTEVAS